MTVLQVVFHPDAAARLDTMSQHYKVHLRELEERKSFQRKPKATWGEPEVRGFASIAWLGWGS